MDITLCLQVATEDAAISQEHILTWKFLITKNLYNIVENYGSLQVGEKYNQTTPKMENFSTDCVDKQN